LGRFDHVWKRNPRGIDEASRQYERQSVRTFVRRSQRSLNVVVQSAMSRRGTALALGARPCRTAADPIAELGRSDSPALAGPNAILLGVVTGLSVLAAGSVSGALGALWFERSGPVVAPAAAMPRALTPADLAEQARTHARV
jgi:hypothetical protein